MRRNSPLGILSRRKYQVQAVLGCLSALVVYGMLHTAIIITVEPNRVCDSELASAKKRVLELGERLKAAERLHENILFMEKKKVKALVERLHEKNEKPVKPITVQPIVINQENDLKIGKYEIGQKGSRHDESRTMSSAEERMVEVWPIETNISKQRDQVAFRLKKRATISRHRDSMSLLYQEACEIGSADLGLKAVAARLALSQESSGKQCAFGRTRKTQLLRIKQLAHNPRNHHVVFSLVDFSHDVCLDHRLSHLRRVWSAARSAGLTRHASFFFACADGASLALLCAAGLPAVAATNIAADRAQAVFKAAAADAALMRMNRRRRRLLELSQETNSIGSPLADAQVFESFLAESSFASNPISPSVQVLMQQQHKEEGNTQLSRLALRLDMAAELSFRGVDAIALDHNAVVLMPTHHADAFFRAIFADYASTPTIAFADDDDAPSETAVWKRFRRDSSLVDDDETKNNQDIKDARPKYSGTTSRSLLHVSKETATANKKRPQHQKKRKRPAVRVATRQWSTHTPCPEFIASLAGNSSTRLLKGLAKTARSAKSNEAIMLKALATELRLNVRGSAGSVAPTLVACNPRPNLRHPRARLGAAVFANAMNIQTTAVLASELGLHYKDENYTRTIELRGGVIDLSEGSPVASSAKYLRVVVAHLVTIAFLTGRALKLPTVFMDGRSYFLWSYLDIGALADDFGIDLMYSTEYNDKSLRTRATIRPRINKRRWRSSQPNIMVRWNSKLPRFFELRDKLEPQFVYRPEISLFSAAEVLNNISSLTVDLSFLDHHYATIFELPRRQAFHPATLVANRLKWCTRAFGTHTESRIAPATAVCWKRGAIVDSYSELSYQAPSTLIASLSLEDASSENSTGANNASAEKKFTTMISTPKVSIPNENDFHSLNFSVSPKNDFILSSYTTAALTLKKAGDHTFEDLLQDDHTDTRRRKDR